MRRTKKQKPKTLAELLVSMDACYRSVEWAKQYDADGTDFRRAWEECDNYCWLWWVAEKADEKGLGDKAGDAVRDTKKTEAYREYTHAGTWRSHPMMLSAVRSVLPYEEIRKAVSRYVD